MSQCKLILRVNRPDQTIIKNAAGNWQQCHNPRNGKSLTNHKHQYRLRAGNYRVLFNFDGVVKIVYIEEVRKRENAPTNIQIINGPNGKPTFVVIPYDEYVKPREGSETYVPHEVVSIMVDNEWNIARAWREHLGVTQQEMAQRLGVSQSAYSQQESRLLIWKCPTSCFCTSQLFTQLFFSMLCLGFC